VIGLQVAMFRSMGRRRLDCRSVILPMMLLAMAFAACGGNAVEMKQSLGGSPGNPSNGPAGTGGAAPSSEAGVGNGAGQNLVSYPCVGGFVYVESDGEGSFAGAGSVELMPWTGALRGESSCVLGQAICHITSVPDIEIGVAPTSSCTRLSGTLAACASTPNCACICSHGFNCSEACTCTDTHDLATVSCQET
jgi:hypothetical protein